MLGVLLSLKQRAGMTSLFDTNHLIFVMLVVALTVYCGALIGATYILKAHSNSNFGKFVSSLSLSFGALTFILELMILVPYLGSAALLIWFVSFVAVYLYPYIKTWFTSAVGGIVHTCENLIEYLKNMIIARCFTMKPDEEQSGLP
ncbi:hypothetical protein L3X38_020183 [Prunus dulcis]|uniref:Uncharacterized protein n=1 Tax=Prunus dulcis TaxID=3755 RepID=A0AAD4WE15_PRUDU|nr:hypothetical protein L3X38_020183 [Prunus dulcis]